MHSSSRLPFGLKKIEKHKLWFKPEYKRAIYQWKKEISVARRNDDKQGQLKYNFRLAETYYSLELYAHVINYSKVCIDIAKTVGDRSSELKACHLLVKTYDALKKCTHPDAFQYGRRCIELADEINEKKYYLKDCYLLIKAYGLLDQYDSAVIYGKKYLEYATETGNKECELNAYYLLMRACDSLNQYDAETVFYCQKCIDITEKTGNENIKFDSCLTLVKTYEHLKQYDEVAISYFKKCLEIIKAETGNNAKSEMKVCYLLVKAYGLLEQYDDSIPYIKRYIEITQDLTDTHSELKGRHLLGIAYASIGKYDKAINCSKKSVEIAREIGNHQYEMESCLQLARAYSSQKNYDEAVIYCNDCIEIAKQMGDTERELKGWHLLGIAYDFIGKYDKAITCSKKSVEIARQIGNHQYEIESCLQLARAYFSQKNYDEAVIYCNDCIEIAKQTNDGSGLTKKTYLLLGKVHYSLNQYSKAIVFCRKCVRVCEDQFTGNQEEIDAYSILVEAHCCLEEYDEVITNGEMCIRKAQLTNQEHGLANVYYFLGKTFYSLKSYDDAANYCEKCIDIAKQNGDKSREIEGGLLLANVFYEGKRYNDAINQSKKCIHNANQESDKLCEIMDAHFLIGRSYFALACYEDATHNIKKCIKMAKETGHLKLELKACILGARLFLLAGSIDNLVLAIAQSLVLADELHDSLAKQFAVEITFAFLEQREHDRKNSSLENSGSPEEFQTLESKVNLDCEKEAVKKMKKLIVLHERYIQEVQNHQRVNEAIATLKQLADIDLNSMTKFLKSFCHQRIGVLYLDGGQSEEAKSQLSSAMSCAKNVGSAEIENKIILKCCRILGVAYFEEGETEQSICLLRESIRCIDFLVKNMEADENTIIDFIDEVSDCYNYLAKGLIEKNRIWEALLVLEQRTARALKEQLISRHDINTQGQYTEHITYHDIMSLVSRNKYSILFCSVFSDCLYTFLVEEGSDVQFRQFPSRRTDTEKSIKKMLESFSICKKSRTLTDMYSDIAHQDISKTIARILAYFGSSSRSRTPKEPCENTDIGSLDDLQRLHYKLFGEMSIKQDELVIIPDGLLYKVPFAALRNSETGRYLSETIRVRIAPSMTTLKLLQEIPVDHNKNPALVVGNPLVGEVMLDGEMKNFRPLSAAFREVDAISSILNVMPLTGEMATKPAVIERLQREVSIIHIAAHGCKNNGTIALAPTPETRGTKIPVEEDYMLTMADVQQARVRAQLVVLSCCDTGLGEIKAEGVVGMCRAFLASGARAVVASLWAIHDRATSEFMKRFHHHLNAGESASASLQQTMQDMRQLTIYSDPKYWAPFFLLGDDITIN